MKEFEIPWRYDGKVKLLKWSYISECLYSNSFAIVASRAKRVFLNATSNGSSSAEWGCFIIFTNITRSITTTFKTLRIQATAFVRYTAQKQRVCCMWYNAIVVYDMTEPLRSNLWPSNRRYLPVRRVTSYIRCSSLTTVRSMKRNLKQVRVSRHNVDLFIYFWLA